MEVGAKEIAVFASASEEFSLRNINCNIAESLNRFADIFESAKTDGIKVRGCGLRHSLPAAIGQLLTVTTGTSRVSLGAHTRAGWIRRPLLQLRSDSSRADATKYLWVIRLESGHLAASPP